MGYQYLREYAYGNINKETLLELSTLYQDVKEECRKDSKEVTKLIKAAKKESDAAKKKTKYQEALDLTKDLRDSARQIPDEDWDDWLWNVLMEPMYAAEIMLSVASGEGIRGVPRTTALGKYDELINKLNREIKKL